MMDVRDLASPLVWPEATNNKRDVDANNVNKPNDMSKRAVLEHRAIAGAGLMNVCITSLC